MFTILQIFFETLAVLEIGNSLGYSPVLPERNIHSRDVFRPIARERKCLMDSIYYLFLIANVIRSAELAMIISYSTSAGTIIVLLKTPRGAS